MSATDHPEDLDGPEYDDPPIATYSHEDTVVFYDTQNPEAWLQIHNQEVWNLENGDLR